MHTPILASLHVDMKRTEDDDGTVITITRGDGYEEVRFVPDLPDGTKPRFLITPESEPPPS